MPKTLKKDAMATASDVAKYLIHRAEREDEPEYLSHLRLQKLLYYVQGWHLAITDKPMFPDRIEAWAHGPVVAALYPQFADYKFQPIQAKDIPQPKAISDEVAAFIDAVWKVYKGYSATSLREMTHREAPWKDARGDLDGAAKCTNEITHKAMKAFFTKRAGK